MHGYFPDSMVHGANMWPIWGQQDSDGPHVGPMKFAIWFIPMYSSNSMIPYNLYSNDLIMTCISLLSAVEALPTAFNIDLVLQIYAGESF